MAKNIEINILDSSGSYETLYPTTDYNNLLNKPTIPTVPSLPLSIANGGTAGNSAANAVYNLLQGLSSRTASNVNSYASSTYLGCYYGSTGYKVPISNLMTYINNNVSVSGGLREKYGSVKSNGSSGFTITTGLNSCYFCLISKYDSGTKSGITDGYGIAFRYSTSTLDVGCVFFIYDVNTTTTNVIYSNNAIRPMPNGTIVLVSIGQAGSWLINSSEYIYYYALGT